MAETIATVLLNGTLENWTAQRVVSKSGDVMFLVQDAEGNVGFLGTVEQISGMLNGIESAVETLEEETVSEQDGSSGS